jgi:hypothetical protein
MDPHTSDNTDIYNRYSFTGERKKGTGTTALGCEIEQKKIVIRRIVIKLPPLTKVMRKKYFFHYKFFLSLFFFLFWQTEENSCTRSYTFNFACNLSMLNIN